MADRLLRD